MTSPMFSADGRYLFFVVTDDRTRWLGRVAIGATDVTELTEGPPVISDYSMNAEGKIAVINTSDRQPGEVFTLDGDASRQLSHQNDAWLAEVQLGPESTRTLRRLERLYREVHSDAHAADAELKQRAAADRIAVALTALTGIGPVLAMTLRAEIGDISRFRRGPELACYAGVVPRVDASASRVYHGRITRDGSPWLRWALVEAAGHAMKRPDAVGRWARRLAVRKGAMKARVALARVLCDEVVAAWPRA